MVDAEARMHFQSDLSNAVLSGEGRRFPPIGNEDLVPLVVQNLLKILRPGTGDPVGIVGVRIAAGAAGKGVDSAEPQPLGQQDRVPYGFIIGPGRLRIGMDRIAMTA